MFECDECGEDAIYTGRIMAGGFICGECWAAANDWGFDEDVDLTALADDDGGEGDPELW